MIYAFYVSFVVILCWAVFQSWQQQAKTETIQPWKSFSHLLGWYLPYLFFPCLAIVLYLSFTGQMNIILGLVLSALLLCCIYARFIEPTTLRIQYHQHHDFLAQGNKNIKIALISDLHIGLFSGHQQQLETIIQQIQQANVDLVLIAGDWSYEPTLAQLKHIELFQQIDIPIYSVFGNHDEQCPGPLLRPILEKHLTQANIIDIEDAIVEYDGFYLVGIGDLWAERAHLEFLANCPTNKPYVILSHNPDTADMVPAISCKALMLAGHTHGGQVKLPYLTPYYLQKKSQCGHVSGWYQHQHTDLFVSVGTGMVGVPFRFLTPPTIDIIELTN